MDPDEEPEATRVPLGEDLREGAVGPLASDEHQGLVGQDDEARRRAEQLLRQRVARLLQRLERAVRIGDPRGRLQFEAASEASRVLLRDLLDDEVRHLAADGAERDPPERRRRRLSADVGEGEKQSASGAADGAHDIVPCLPQLLEQGEARGHQLQRMVRAGRREAAAVRPGQKPVLHAVGAESQQAERVVRQRNARDGMHFDARLVKLPDAAERGVALEDEDLDLRVRVETDEQFLPGVDRDGQNGTGSAKAELLRDEVADQRSPVRAVAHVVDLHPRDRAGTSDGDVAETSVLSADDETPVGQRRKGRRLRRETRRAFPVAHLETAAGQSLHAVRIDLQQRHLRERRLLRELTHHGVRQDDEGPRLACVSDETDGFRLAHPERRLRGCVFAAEEDVATGDHADGVEVGQVGDVRDRHAPRRPRTQTLLPVPLLGLEPASASNLEEGS